MPNLLPSEFYESAPIIDLQAIRLNDVHVIQVLNLQKVNPLLNGNKYFKLKYHLLHAQKHKIGHLISMGGAYSNHLLSLSKAGRLFGFQTTGIVRGDELSEQTRNPVLKYCENLGMRLFFISREQYRLLRIDPNPILKNIGIPEGYFIEEGGGGTLGFKGALELGRLVAALHSDFVFCSCGTGVTLAGIIQSAPSGQNTIGVSSFKASYIKKNIQTYLLNSGNNMHVFSPDLGGFAQKNKSQKKTIAYFKSKFGLSLDKVYTWKTMSFLKDYVAQKNIDRNSRILFVDTQSENKL